MRKRILVSVLFFLSNSLIFSQILKMSLPEIIQKSDRIVRTKVVQTEARWVSDDRGKHIMTTVFLECSRFLKGDSTAQAFSIEIPGGTVDNTTEWVSTMPVLTAGEETILFLTDKGKPIGGKQGCFKIREGMVSGAEGIVRVESFIHTVCQILGQTEDGVKMEDRKMDSPKDGDPGQGIQGDQLQSRTNAPVEKGMFLPEKIASAGPVRINRSSQSSDWFQESAPNRAESPRSPQAWQTIMSENFEGTFPGTGWTVGAQSGYTNAYWDETNFRSHTGSYSAWCADAGTAAGTPGGSYKSNMIAWAEYGPFNLSDASDAKLDFYYWNNSESGYDFLYWMASIDGSMYYGDGTTGNSGGWQSESFDLKNVYTLGNLTGRSQVWIAFIFTSDASIESEGAFVDDVVLQKYIGTPLPDLEWTILSLSSDAWTSGASVTAYLTERNNGSVTAGAHQTQLYLSTDNTITTGDTPLGTPMAFSSIQGSSTQVQSVTFTVPGVANGAYYIGALVDINSQVTESNETNNGGVRTGQVTVGQPGSTVAITPNIGPAGTNATVTITGSNFGSSQGIGSVAFYYAPGESKLPADIVSWSNSTILCRVPAGTSSGPVTVTSSGGQVSDVLFRVTFGDYGIRWPGSAPTVPYRINENCGLVTGEGAQIQTAASTWNGAGSLLTLQYAGSTAAVTSSSNAINEILWGTEEDGIIAMTSIWFTGSTITECDMVFNTLYGWSTSGSPGTFDIQTIALHELGHFFVLIDLYGDLGDGVYDVGKVMYGFGDYGLVKRVLHTDDADGVRFIYGTGSVPILSVSPTVWTAPVGGGTSAAVSVNNAGSGGSISYTVADDAAWLTTSVTAGTTPGSFTMTAQANAGASSRTASVTVTATGVSGSPRTIWVTQPSGTTASIKPISPASVSAGEEFWVEVNVGDPNQVSNLFAASFELNYTNTSFLDYISAEAGAFLGTDLVFLSMPDDAGGKVGIGISRKAPAAGVSGSGVIVRVKFRVSGSASGGTTFVFSLSNVAATDPTGTGIDFASDATSTSTVGAGMIVWPGDTDNNGTVNQADVLPIGLYWALIGPTRSGASMSWTGQLCTPWTPSNATYADANGDGIVNQTDVLAIGLNWGKTHAGSTPGSVFPNLVRSGDFPGLRVVLSGSTENEDEFLVEIRIGDKKTPVSDLFGVSFVVELDDPANVMEMVEASPGPFLGDDAVVLQRKGERSGTLGFGISRKTGQKGVDGSGVVARIRMKKNCPEGGTCVFSIRDIVANDHRGCALDMKGEVSTINLQNGTAASWPSALALLQNHPNPFNPSTNIRFSLKEEGPVVLKVYDGLGREVRTLVEGWQEAGEHEVTFEAEGLASGNYYIRLETGGEIFTKKMLLVR